MIGMIWAILMYVMRIITGVDIVVLSYQLIKLLDTILTRATPTGLFTSLSLNTILFALTPVIYVLIDKLIAAKLSKSGECGDYNISSVAKKSCKCVSHGSGHNAYMLNC